MNFLHFILLIICLILISLPRFNWGKLGPLNSFVGDKPFDVEQYEAYTEFFRGDSSKKEILEGPFSYRPLVPLLASFLPFKPLTSINVVNLIALIICLPILKRMLGKLKFEYKYAVFGQVIFVFSFPLFYYAATGYVDSALLFFILLSVYLIISEQYPLFFFAFIFGMAVKETMIIIIPVFIAHLVINSKIGTNTKIYYLTTIVLIFLAESFLLRNLVSDKTDYLWMPRPEVLIENLTRLKTYASFILSFGIPGLGAILYFKNSGCRFTSSKIEFVLLTGLICTVLLSIFSIFAAYSDGRHIWLSYPFTIPLSAAYFRYRNNSISNS